jgi:hypothetical protein
MTRKVLFPGVTVLERHVAHLRSRVQERIWALLSRGLSQEVKTKLETLLSVPDGGHHSLLDRLRKGPFRRSAPELVRALRRIEDVRTLGLTIGVCEIVGC